MRDGEWKKWWEASRYRKARRQSLLSGALQAETGQELARVFHAAARSLPEPRIEGIPDVILLMIEEVPQPTIVRDQAFTIRASNRLARQLAESLQPGRNLAEEVFLRLPKRLPAVDLSTVEERVAAQLVRRLHQSPDNQSVAVLVDRLSMQSGRFRSLLSGPLPETVEGATTTWRNETCGTVEMVADVVPLPGYDGLEVVRYSAERYSVAEAAVALLRTATALSTSPPARQCVLPIAASRTTSRVGAPQLLRPLEPR